MKFPLITQLLPNSISYIGIVYITWHQISSIISSGYNQLGNFSAKCPHNRCFYKITKSWKQKGPRNCKPICVASSWANHI